MTSKIEFQQCQVLLYPGDECYFAQERYLWNADEEKLEKLR